jgi:hypothetical protein
MITLVLLVIFFIISSSLISHVSGSISAKTTLAPELIIPLIVAKAVKGEVITSSFFFISIDLRAIVIPSVAFTTVSIFFFFI